MPTRSRSRSGQPEASLAPLVIGLGVVAAAAAVWFGYPAGIVAWLTLTAAAWTEPNPTLTGKTRSGQVVPADDREAAALRQHRFFTSLRVCLLLPTRAWLPGWPGQASWLLAGTTFLLALGQPLRPGLSPGLGLVSAACAWLVVTATGHAARASAETGCPGTHTGALRRVLAGTSGRVALGAGVVGGLACAVALLTLAAPHLPPATPVVFLAAGAALGVPVLFLLPVWRPIALAQWRTDCAARAEWKPRWEGLRLDPAPYLLSRRTVGRATVDSFDAPAHQGARAFTVLLPRLAPSLGTARYATILNVPDLDSSGRPMPGTTHPLRFQVAQWDLADVPDLTDPALDPEEARLFAESAFAQVTDTGYTGRMLLLSMDRITADDSPKVAWATTWASPVGLELSTLRAREETGPLSEALRGAVLIDHRAPCLYVGALHEPDTVFADGEAAVQAMCELAREDHWNRVWSTSSRQTANQPTIAHPTYRQATLAGGQTVHRQAFVTRVGVDPVEYFGTEARLSASMSAPPYVAVTGWPAPGQRPGERHPQGLAVYWSEQPVPDSPSSLPPTPGHPPSTEDPAAWVLAGMVNKAFGAAKLARPEVVTARCLTSARSARQHLWRIRVRLHDGVTAADVRGKRERLRTSLGVPWLRVTDAPDGVDVYAGAAPDEQALADPARDLPALVGLDWEQAFLDSRLVGSGGDLPRLVTAGHLEHNRDVADLEFDLVPGLSTDRLRGAVEKLRTATGNFYLDVRQSSAGPDRVRMLAAKANPLPDRAGVDFAQIDATLAATGARLFGTGVEGEPVGFDPKVDPHALLAGLTGAGKSSLAQVILYGCAVAGDLLVVIDPVKGGADFAFLGPYLWGLADDPHTAAATMQAVYAEVVARKTVNSRYGVGSYRELPEQVRPRHIVVFVDEFTSLIGKDVAPARSDDPETELERERVESTNAAKLKVGTFAGRFAREARSAGVTLLLGTQKLNAKILDSIPGGTDLKSNLARSLLGNGNQGDRMAALRDWQAAPRLDPPYPPGRGLWESNAGRPELVQCWYASQADYGAALAERIQPLPQDAKLDVTRYLPKQQHDDGFGPPPGLFGPDGTPLQRAVGHKTGVSVTELDEIDLSLDELEAYLGKDPDSDGAIGAVGTEPAASPEPEQTAPADDPAGHQDLPDDDALPETGILAGDGRLVLASLFEPVDEPVPEAAGVPGWGDELDWGARAAAATARPVPDADDEFTGPPRTAPELVHAEPDPFG